MKASKDCIVYRHPGAGSGVSVFKKTSTVVQDNSKIKEDCNKKINELNLSNDYSECIFGSTSPRCNTYAAMNTSEYIGSTFPSNNESDNNISSCSTLDIVNKVEHNFPELDLKSQLRELSQRLLKSERERDEFKRKMEDAIDEKEQCFRRLEHISASNESRITEMHCVIAELSKKLRNKENNVIVEETEVEGSEISYQEGSIYNSELNLTNPDVECQTDPLEEEEDASFHQGNVKIANDSVVKSSMDALQEEVLHLRAEIALLQSKISVNPCCSSPLEVKAEYIGNQDLECDDYNNFNDNDAKEFYKTERQNDEKCVPKVAERIVLKQNIKPEIIDFEINKTEHLMKDIAIEDHFMSSSTHHLQNKLEKYKIQNSVLTLTLRECKEHCDHLYLLCGKYESNAIALQAALTCSDRAIEAYDVMLALLESKLAILVDNSAASRESRKEAENVAQHLLDRLECEKDSCENSLGPWQNSFSITDKCKPWTADNENRLRNHVSKLKGRRSALQNTFVVLESPFSQIHDKVQIAYESKECYMENLSTMPVTEALESLSEALNKNSIEYYENHQNI